jgi:hypothetical protein
VRLTALLASDAPVGLVFRRGPTKLFRLYRWDRGNDTFEAGSVFKGRLYPDRSDISPDGRLLIYFAMGGLEWAVEETNGCWTAISRLPHLTAMALWGQEGTWGGGGMFTSNGSYWLNTDAHTFTMRDNTRSNNGELKRDFRKPPLSRLERGGWKVTKDRREKELPEGWRLRVQNSRRGDCYSLENTVREELLSFPHWDWADWDRTRLVWAEGSCLHAVQLTSLGLSDARMLHDFNADFTP